MKAHFASNETVMITNGRETVDMFDKYGENEPELPKNGCHVLMSDLRPLANDLSMN